MGVPPVSRYLVLGLTTLLAWGCDTTAVHTRTVTVQIDVTSSGSPVTWSGAIRGDESVPVQGITPSSQQIPLRVTPLHGCAPSDVCGTVVIETNIVGTARGPGNSAVAATFTVCVTEMENKNHACRTDSGTVRVFLAP